MTICDTYGKLKKRMVTVCAQKARIVVKNAEAVPGSQICTACFSVVAVVSMRVLSRYK